MDTSTGLWRALVMQSPLVPSEARMSQWASAGRAVSLCSPPCLPCLPCVDNPLVLPQGQRDKVINGPGLVGHVSGRPGEAMAEATVAAVKQRRSCIIDNDYLMEYILH